MNGLDKQVKNGPSLTEALENAGIFYEAQYKEVKVVANVSNCHCLIVGASCVRHCLSRAAISTGTRTSTGIYS